MTQHAVFEEVGRIGVTVVSGFCSDGISTQTRNHHSYVVSIIQPYIIIIMKLYLHEVTLAVLYYL